MRAVGLGVYHSGVEVHDNEWTFAGGGGVFPHEPKRPPGDGGAFVVLHSTIEIGITTASAADVERITRKLESRFFGPETYNILHHNCNHFSNALCTELTGRGIPGRVNRLANMTSPCSECIPGVYAPPSPAREQPALDSSFGVHAEEMHRGAFSGPGRSLSEDRPPSEDRPLGAAAVRQARLRIFEQKQSSEN